MCCLSHGCARSQPRMCSIVWCVFSRSSVLAPCTFNHGHCVRLYCVRSHKMRSIADNCLKILTAQVLKRWRLRPARAMRGLRLTWPALDLMRCDRSQCTRSHQVRSIAPSALDRTKCDQSHWQGSNFYFCSISPFWNPICIKDLQHTKTQNIRY